MSNNFRVTHSSTKRQTRIGHTWHTVKNVLYRTLMQHTTLTRPLATKRSGKRTKAERAPKQEFAQKNTQCPDVPRVSKFMSGCQGALDKNGQGQQDHATDHISTGFCAPLRRYRLDRTGQGGFAALKTHKINVLSLRLETKLT